MVRVDAAAVREGLRREGGTAGVLRAEGLRPGTREYRTRARQLQRMARGQIRETRKPEYVRRVTELTTVRNPRLHLSGWVRISADLRYRRDLWTDTRGRWTRAELRDRPTFLGIFAEFFRRTTGAPLEYDPEGANEEGEGGSIEQIDRTWWDEGIADDEEED